MGGGRGRAGAVEKGGGAYGSNPRGVVKGEEQGLYRRKVHLAFSGGYRLPEGRAEFLVQCGVRWEGALRHFDPDDQHVIGLTDFTLLLLKQF